MAVTKIADVVVPQIFTPYKQQITEQKSALIQSGVVVRDPALDTMLAGGGLTFNTPSWKDLDNDEENASSDDDGTSSVPKKIGTATEISVRLSRNQSWSAMDLASAFHTFYNDCRVRVDDKALMHARVKLILVTQQVLKNVLGILGVDAPSKM